MELRTCKLCGQEFVPKRDNQKICYRKHMKVCPVCGKRFDYSKDVNRLTCSRACGIVLAKETRSKTNLERYGCEFPSQTDSVKRRNSEVTKQLRASNYHSTIASDELEKSAAGVIDISTVSFERIREESKNLLASVLTGLNVHFKRDYDLDGVQYDFAILDLVVIEVIDIVTTLEGTVLRQDRYPGYYSMRRDHANKHNCKYTALYDWDNFINWSWSKYFKQVSIVDASECHTEEITIAEAKTFSIMTQIDATQEDNINARIAIALYFDNDIIATLLAKKCRVKNKRIRYEIESVSYDPEIRCKDSLRLLVTKLVELTGCNDVIFYMDKSKEDARAWLDAGFKIELTKSPQLQWSRGIERISDYYLMTRGYCNIFHRERYEGMNVKHHMMLDGWLPIYDCGQQLLVYNPEEVI